MMGKSDIHVICVLFINFLKNIKNSSKKQNIFGLKMTNYKLFTFNVIINFTRLLFIFWVLSIILFAKAHYKYVFSQFSICINNVPMFNWSLC